MSQTPNTLTDTSEPITSPEDRSFLSKYRQFALTIGFAFSIVALQMGQGVLLARLLGPEARGEYATAVFYVQTLLYIGLFGGLEVVCRYAASNSIEKSSLHRAALRLGITTGIATSVLAVVMILVALPQDKRYLIPLALLCCLSIVGQHVMLIMTAVDRGSGAFGVYNIRRLVAAAAFPALLLITACVVPIDVTLASVLFVVASLVSMGACLVGLSRPLRGPSEPPVPQLLKESRPYAFSMLVTDLFDRLDIVLVLWLVPLIEQGYYAAMTPVVYPLTVIPNTLGLFLFNAGASANTRLTKRDVHSVLGSTLAVQTVSTVVFLLLIGPVVLLLYGEEFRPAIVFALWLAPVSALRGILQGLDSYLKGRGRPLAPVRARLFAMVVMIVTTAVLFSRFDTLAIAMAALVGQIVCFLWLSVLVYTGVQDQIENAEIVPEP